MALVGWLRLQVGCDDLPHSFNWDALILHSCRTWCQCACCLSHRQVDDQWSFVTWPLHCVAAE